jgi:Icc protein
VSKNFLIAQITDCHLPADPRQKYRGINPHANLKALLKKVEVQKPDLLLATGDLSEDGSRASYKALEALFKPFGIPVLALPGNHDDTELLAEIIPGSPVEGISVSEHGTWQIIRLNSCLRGKPEGRVSEQTLEELERHLGNQEQRSRLIAVHHQPITIGSPWIDKYPLLDPGVFLQLIDQHPDVKAVVWGHVHQAFEAVRNGTAMLGGPSSAINSLPGVQKFTEDSNGPACRWLELRVDGTIRSSIVSA